MFGDGDIHMIDIVATRVEAIRAAKRVISSHCLRQHPEDLVAARRLRDELYGLLGLGAEIRPPGACAICGAPVPVWRQSSRVAARRDICGAACAAIRRRQDGEEERQV